MRNTSILSLWNTLLIACYAIKGFHIIGLCLGSLIAGILKKSSKLPHSIEKGDKTYEDLAIKYAIESGQLQAQVRSLERQLKKEKELTNEHQLLLNTLSEYEQVILSLEIQSSRSRCERLWNN